MDSAVWQRGFSRFTAASNTVMVRGYEQRRTVRCRIFTLSVSGGTVGGEHRVRTVEMQLGGTHSAVESLHLGYHNGGTEGGVAARPQKNSSIRTVKPAS
jgi:hypothetical protein